jgi:hypothetical protein
MYVAAFSACVPAGFGPGCGRGAGALGCERDGSRPASHHYATQPQRRRGTALVGWPMPFGDQRPGDHPAVGSPRTAPRWKGGPARRGWSRPVALTSRTSGAIGRARTACSSSGPSRRAEQGWQIRPTSGPAAGHAGQQAAAGDGCAGEASVTAGASFLDLFEADEAGADPRQGRRRLPAFRGQLSEGLLPLDELVGDGWPGRHARQCPTSPPDVPRYRAAGAPRRRPRRSWLGEQLHVDGAAPNATGRAPN